MKYMKLFGVNLLIALGAGALLTYLFFVLYPYKTFEVKSAKVLTHEVKAGTVVFYQVDYCKETTHGSSVQRQLVSDTVAIPYPPVTSVAKEGCHKVKIPLEIPSSTPSGEYTLRVAATFKVNALREITTNFETDTFTVTH